MHTSTTIEKRQAWRGIADRLGRAMKRFAGNRDASTAIEFTALAIPFAMLVFAILESCISFAAQEVLTNATDDIARQLRTGQLRAADVNVTSLKKMICDRLDIVVAAGCPDLIVDQQVTVVRQTSDSVRIYRRADIQTLSCTPYCESPYKSDAVRTSEAEMSAHQ